MTPPHRETLAHAAFRWLNQGIELRPATPADLPALRELIPRSVRELSRAAYSPRQIESAIRYVFGPDSRLIADGTYYVVAAADGALAGCGGWSRRRTLFGGDQLKGNSPHAASDELLDPAVDAARVRAFFVDPGFVRRGVGTRLLAACVEAARAAGFSRLELAATLPGEPLYRRWGFQRDKRFEMTLPDGTEIAFVAMSYNLAASPTT